MFLFLHFHYSFTGVPIADKGTNVLWWKDHCMLRDFVLNAKFIIQRERYFEISYILIFVVLDVYLYVLTEFKNDQ